MKNTERIEMKRIALAVSLSLLGSAALADDRDVLKRICLLEQLTPQNAGMTVAEVLKACEAPAELPLISERAKLEAASYDNPYSITPHRPNYLLPVVYSARSPSSPPFQRVNNDEGGVDKMEAEFQISLKFPVLLGRESGIHWMLAYTNRSFWQIYNGHWSRPFRETNHEPETWVQFPLSGRIPGTDLQLRTALIGINHQSNGQTGEWSRSWNRIMGSVVAESGRFALGFRPWVRISESAGSDDNPDITHYMGSFELLGTYRFPAKQQVTVMFRNNLEAKDNKGALEVGYGFPLPGTPDLRFYVQAFHGYGKSLLDYNVKQTSLGIGLQLVDW